MFSVPGWSLGSDRPKTDTSNKSRKKKKNENSAITKLEDTSQSGEAGSTSSTATSSSAKQVDKRSSGPDAKSRSSNDEKILKRGPAGSKELPSKRQKTNVTEIGELKSRKRSSQVANEVSNDSPGAPSSMPSSALKLTPLQTAMQKKLLGARFRQLNESLYTTASGDAVQLFSRNPSFFDEYHSGFRSQVDSWPENPVDTFVADLKQRGTLRPKKFEKNPAKADNTHEVTSTPDISPLPRSKGKCVVADLGCGDAGLAKAVRKFSGKTGIEVKSYDLQSTHPLVTKADIANLPLPESSVDVAIFCLALMGTNWIDFIEEAWRVLHWKGELWIAEIKSRFGKMERKQTAADKKKKKRPGDLKKQKQTADMDEAEGLIDDAAGPNATKESTDCSAFIGILKKRGFVMENERNVDLSNKMFVRMKFIKAVKPIKGKHKAQLPENASIAAKDKAWRSLLREDEEFDEASTLKPCLYKIR